MKFGMDLPLHVTVRVVRYNRCSERGNSRQWYTNTGRQIAMAIEFCTVEPNLCGPSVWNLRHVTHRAPEIWRWLLDFFWKNN